MASKAAICIRTLKIIPALAGIWQLKRGSKTTIYCALIMSQRYCSEAVMKRFMKMFAAKIPVLAACIRFAAY